METDTTTAISVVKCEVQLREYLAQIEAQKSSGMTAQHWCTENRINPQNLLLSSAKGTGEMCITSTGNRAIDNTQAYFRYPYRERWTENLITTGHHSRYTNRISARVMLNHLSESYQVYLVTGYTDLRRSIDGLATIVQASCSLISFALPCFCFAADAVIASRVCFGKVMDFFCSTNGSTTEDSNGHAPKPKYCC